MPNFISEDQIEKATVALLHDRYGYRTLNCFTEEAEDPGDRSHRTSKEEVVLYDVLKTVAVKLNPTIPEPVVEDALERLIARRYAMSPLLANKEVYGLIRDGIPVQYEDAQGRTEQGRVRVIDFTRPAKTTSAPSPSSGSRATAIPAGRTSWYM
jgi:type I restriction enzyme R subunit